ncbi:MAG: hypothetical protein AB7R67_20355 [Vicinamibacterales bacterium]
MTVARWLLLGVLLAAPAVIMRSCTASVSAQEAVPPTLTDVQQLTLDRHQLRLENLSLRITLLQAEYQTEQAALSVTVRELAHEGWALRRGPDGVWGYTPETAK